MCGWNDPRPLVHIVEVIINNMATNGLFQAHLDTDKAEQVETFRKENKLSKSQLVREALDAFIKPIKEEKAP